MKVINIAFKDDTDKIIAVATVLLSIVFAFIPALLVVLLLKDKVSVCTYEIAKAFLNLELLLFIISLFFIIPIVGWAIGIIGAPLILIFNIIVVIMVLCAMAKGGEAKIPVMFEFI